MKYISIIAVMMFLTANAAIAGEMTQNLIANTQISEINVSTCTSVDVKEARDLSISIFGKKSHKQIGNCSVGAIIIPDDPQFIAAFVDDDEMSFVKKVNANVSADKKYFYSTQRISIEYDKYLICSYNTCNNEMVYKLYTHSQNK